jgi:hypothetical protein
VDHDARRALDKRRVLDFGPARVLVQQLHNGALDGGGAKVEDARVPGREQRRESGQL